MCYELFYGNIVVRCRRPSIAIIMYSSEYYLDNVIGNLNDVSVKPDVSKARTAMKQVGDIR